MLRYFNEFNLHQYNDIMNVSQCILDLVFSNVCDVSVGLAMETLCACDKYHPAIEISLPIPTRCSIGRGMKVKF